MPLQQQPTLLVGGLGPSAVSGAGLKGVSCHHRPPPPAPQRWALPGLKAKQLPWAAALDVTILVPQSFQGEQTAGSCCPAHPEDEVRLSIGMEQWIRLWIRDEKISVLFFPAVLG